VYGQVSDLPHDDEKTGLKVNAGPLAKKDPPPAATNLDGPNESPQVPPGTVRYPEVSRHNPSFRGFVGTFVGGHNEPFEQFSLEGRVDNLDSTGSHG